MSTAYVFLFGTSRTDGAASMKNLLGGKGANLAEMCRLGITVPSGFTISTEACTVFTEKGKEVALKLIEVEVQQGVAFVEDEMGKKFGDAADPLLVSVRCGARASMPGMMDTILNLGLNDETVDGLAAQVRQRALRLGQLPPLRPDVRRRRAGPEAATPRQTTTPSRSILERSRTRRASQVDNELTADDLQGLVAEFKAVIKARTGQTSRPIRWSSCGARIGAVFGSWMNDRAHGLSPHVTTSRTLGHGRATCSRWCSATWATTARTGVAFTRDSATGENKFYGEFLINAQGEDVVAGIRTPQLAGMPKWRWE